MKRLSKVVNIVPVIAKADTLTLEERVYFKQRVGLSTSSQAVGRNPPGLPRARASPGRAVLGGRVLLAAAVPLQAAVSAGRRARPAAS